MSRKPRLMLPLLDELKTNLNYDPETGYLTWKLYRTGGPYIIKVNDRADHLFPPMKYRCVYWKRVGHYAHRVAWLLMTETEPPEENRSY